MKKQKLKLAALITASALFLVMTGCSNSIVIKNKKEDPIIDVGSGSGKTVSHGVHSFDGQEINKLNIQSDVMNVMFEQATSEQLSIELITNEKLKDKVKYEVNKKKDEIDVEIKHKGVVNSISGERTLLIKLPSSEHLSIKVNHEYGDVIFDGVVLNELDVDLSVGEIELTNITSNKNNIKVATGDIEVSGLKGQLMVEADVGDVDISKVKATSGNIEINSGLGDIDVIDSVSEELIVKVNTGTVKVDNIDATLKLDVNLGDINISEAAADYDIEALADLGSIKLGYRDVPDQVAFDLSTELGKIKINNKELADQIKVDGKKVVTKIGSGETNVKLNSEMGEIIIK